MILSYFGIDWYAKYIKLKLNSKQSFSWVSKWSCKYIEKDSENLRRGIQYESNIVMKQIITHRALKGHSHMLLLH